MNKILGKYVDILSWCEDLEEGALHQASNLSRLPFLKGNVCLMPDTHRGYGMPIGGVIACDKVVIPNAVGVDIGCGMRATKTHLTGISDVQLKKIMGLIREKIPTGFNHHTESKRMGVFLSAPVEIPVINRELKSSMKQIGTLGGGNHFIEIQKGDDGHIWIMLHSGSRNFGYKIAQEYNKIAQRICRQWHSNIPEFKGEDGLAFLPIESKEGKEYMVAMKYAMEFAYHSRALMMAFVREAFYDVTKTSTANDIDVHHNYARWENHFGNNVIIHRKGATSAKEGELGIIPGSQGTSSYIVRGKGNPASFMSCSHGAGRTMSRSKARKTLDLQNEIDILNKAGVIHGLRSLKELDEASSAYKDINVVMKEQADLIDIEVKLKPLAVIKA